LISGMWGESGEKITEKGKSAEALIM